MFISEEFGFPLGLIFLPRQIRLLTSVRGWLLDPLW